MSAVTDRPPPVDVAQFDRLWRRNRGLTIIVVMLAVGLLALGAWVIYDLTTEPANSYDKERKRLRRRSSPSSQTHQRSGPRMKPSTALTTWRLPTWSQGTLDSGRTGAGVCV